MSGSTSHAGSAAVLPRTRLERAPTARTSATAITDPVVRGAVVDVIARVDRVLETPRPARDRTDGSLGLESARAELASRLVRLAERLRHPVREDRWSASRDQVVDLLRDVHAVAARLEAASDARRDADLGAVTDVVAALRRAGSLTALLDVAPEIVTRLGFRRVLLSSARDGRLWPLRCTDLDTPSREGLLLAAGREPAVALGRDLREADLLRDRRPTVVRNAQGDPRGHPGLRRATGWTSYVVAPVTVGGDVVGFVHVDRGVDAVTRRDAEILGVVVEAAGPILEHLDSQRRVLAIRAQAREALQAVDDTLSGEGARPGARLPRVRPGIDDVLTSREIDVLRLLATGATNAVIAATLVIAESTAKTHVKNVLRKLDVGNRAEAVARFLGAGDPRA